MNHNQFADDLIDECKRRHDECKAAGNEDAAEWWRAFAILVHMRAYPSPYDEDEIPGNDVRNLAKTRAYKWLFGPEQ